MVNYGYRIVNNGGVPMPELNLLWENMFTLEVPYQTLAQLQAHIDALRCPATAATQPLSLMIGKIVVTIWAPHLHRLRLLHPRNHDVDIGLTVDILQ